MPGLLNLQVIFKLKTRLKIYIGLSRGRGIRCYNDIGEILEHIRVKESEWVAQKYIENPLIIKNRKVLKNKERFYKEKYSLILDNGFL